MALCVHANSLQSCPILCDPRDCSPPGSSAHEILQARILEWVAMPSSRGSSIKPMSPLSPALADSSLPLAPPGKPVNVFTSHKQRRTCWCFIVATSSTCQISSAVFSMDTYFISSALALCLPLIFNEIKDSSDLGQYWEREPG